MTKTGVSMMTIAEADEPVAGSIGACGDESYFEREAIPLLRPLYRHALRITGNHADAEDLLQDTLVRAYAGIETFRQGSNFAGWMYRILVNTYITGYRKRQRRPAQFPIHDISDRQLAANTQRSSDGPRSVEEMALDTLSDNRIRSAMRALPEQFRTAVYYADIEGFRCKEIAELMDSPVGTVISRLHRGRRLLRSLLADVA
jgi:RNA polymerase sigma-70 factor (ECF subfamily)